MLPGRGGIPRGFSGRAQSSRTSSSRCSCGSGGWRAANGRCDPSPSSTKIPREQYLYPEFQLARKLFRARGISTLIVDPAELAVDGGRLCAKGEPVDLVYNRLTDFYFDDPRNQALRTAYVDDLAVVTPHPRAHALYADKHNLALLSDADALRGFGVQDALVDSLTRGVPLTRTVTAGEQDWWRERKDWFFKPRHGYGSRGAYRGDKMTRRVFEDVMRGNYMAQELTPPSQRWRTDSQRQGSIQSGRALLYVWRTACS